jgi:hypothetical protein
MISTPVATTNSEYLLSLALRSHLDTNVRVCPDGGGGERPENVRTVALGDHTSKLGPTKNLIDLVEGANEGVALSSGQERTAW